MAATLNPDEVSALMSAVQEGRVETTAPARSVSVTPFDLTSRDRIIRGQMPTLDSLNEQVASALEMGLSGRTRLSLHVASQPATLLRFQDLQPLLAPPATLAVLKLGHGDSQGLAVLEAGLTDGLLAAALGDRKARASGPPTTGRRELTAVEQRVLAQLLGVLTEAMRVAWADILPLCPEVVRFEPDPRMAVLGPPNEVAVLCTLVVTGAVAGQIQLAIPYAAVEPAKSKLASPPRPARSDRRFAEAWMRELEQVPVEVRGTLGMAHLTLERLLEIEVGDVLNLDTDESAPLPVFVQGRLKFHAEPSVQNGGYALRVASALGVVD